MAEESTVTVGDGEYEMTFRFRCKWDAKEFANNTMNATNISEVEVKLVTD